MSLAAACNKKRIRIHGCVKILGNLTDVRAQGKESEVVFTRQLHTYYIWWDGFNEYPQHRVLIKIKEVNEEKTIYLELWEAWTTPNSKNYPYNDGITTTLDEFIKTDEAVWTTWLANYP